MIIEINNESLEKVESILKANNIEFNFYDNVYWATCKEEISQAADCSDLLDNESFYDMAGDIADDVIYEMTDELYNSREANNAFQDLAEAAQLIANRKINELNSMEA